MTRLKFTEELRKALSGRVSHTTVNENVSYYENYIDSEIKKGRREKEVLEELGDPRLIAKTIIDTAQGEEAEAVEREAKASSGKSFSGRVIRLPLWLLGILAVLLLILIFKVVGLVLGLLMPIIIPVAVVYYLIRYFRRR